MKKSMSYFILSITIIFLGFSAMANEGNQKTEAWRFDPYQTLLAPTQMDWESFANTYLRHAQHESTLSAKDYRQLISGFVVLGMTAQAADLLEDSLVQKQFSSQAGFEDMLLQSMVWESFNPVKAIEIWKTILSANEAQKNEDYLAALYHILRISHDNNMIEKADLYIRLVSNLSFETTPGYARQHLRAEMLRNAWLKNDAAYAHSIQMQWIMEDKPFAALGLAELLALQTSGTHASTSTHWKQAIEQQLNETILRPTHPLMLINIQQLLLNHPFADNQQAFVINRQLMSAFKLMHENYNAVAEQLLLNQSELSRIITSKDSKQQRTSLIYWLVAFLMAFGILFAVYKVSILLKLKIKGIQKNIQSVDNQIDEQANLTKSEISLDQRIQDKIASLSIEIKERAKIDIELKNALEKAEKANYLKNAFLANMSHEIRTPLNGILGFSSLLETELALMENQDLFDYANSIQQSGERLLHLLNNIIDISRLEANDMEMYLQVFDVSSVLNEVTEMYRPKAKDKGLRLVLDCKAINVYADQNTLKRVFLELIDNAFKYTDKGFVKVAVFEEEEHIIVTIKDTGIGIDQSYLPFITEAFRQESLGYTRQYQGAGLGIPLTKRLIEKMGGHFSVQSEKAVGTEIKLKLPKQVDFIQQSDIQAVVTKSEHESFSPKELSILIVEDDLASAKILMKIVGNEARASLAYNGEEAISLIENQLDKGEQFDLFLFDINLPAPWDGIRLLQHLRTKYKACENIPAIAQTAYAMAGDEQTLIHAGFSGYVSKPVNKQVLHKEIAKVMLLDKNES